MNRDLHDASLVILSAGSSTRFGGFKQFAQVGPNKEMIWEYSVYEAFKRGIRTVVFVTRKELKEDFVRIIKKKLPSEIEVHFALQELPKEFRDFRSKPLGTGQALIASLPFVRKYNILLNGDDYYGPRTFDLGVNFLQNDQAPFFPGTLSFPIKSTLSSTGSVSRAVIKVNMGQVEEIEEFENIQKNGTTIQGMGINSGALNLDENSQVSMNFWLLEREMIKSIEKGFNKFLEEMENPTSGEFQLPTAIWNYCQKMDRPLYCHPSDSQWCGLTHPEDQEGVQEFLERKHKSGAYPSPLWK